MLTDWGKLALCMVASFAVITAGVVAVSFLRFCVRLAIARVGRERFMGYSATIIFSAMFWCGVALFLRWIMK